MKVLLADLSHSYSPSAMQSSYPSEDGDGFVVPLGIASIGAYAKKVFDDDIDIALFKFPDDLLNACDDCDIIPPDVIGFSNYVWNTHLNFTIGTELRKRFPNALFVAGGPSEQTDGNGVEEYLLKNKFIDVCVIHEGERTFSEILASLNKNPTPRQTD